MKRLLLLLLVPLALYAQVAVDTVIRLPTWLQDGLFMPELNKLCVQGEFVYYMLDCSTYQVRAQIPMSRRNGAAEYAWNWRRQKLYIARNPRPDSTLVLDAAGDSILRWLTVSPEFFTNTYVSDLDRLYKPARETLFAFDCATDTIVRKIVPPVSGYGIGYATWDSVGQKLYLGMGGPGPALMGVYDYVTDSFTKVIDVGAISAWQPDAMVINYRSRKGCIADHQVEPGRTDVGIADLELDSLVRTVPASIEDGIFRHVASDEIDGKIYIATSDGKTNTPDTLWVYDCATDSVVKKLEYVPRGYGPRCIRWVPWSNRLYIGCHIDMDNQTLDTSIIVVDCNTDSIVARLALGRSCPQSIQLDPIHERIFVIGADSGTIHVLRDVEGGVAEEGSKFQASSRKLEATVLRGVLFLPEATSRKPQAASLLDIGGRKVMDLKPGENDVSRISPGVYFFREEPQAESRKPQAVRKIVITR